MVQIDSCVALCVTEPHYGNSSADVNVALLMMMFSSATSVFISLSVSDCEKNI